MIEVPVNDALHRAIESKEIVLNRQVASGTFVALELAALYFPRPM
jgi:hypothetical protein